ncbi:putative disease resistance RPP13-like protein 1 [Vitis vinifera]|uniref:Putative disease resistance RPP13-like protein 1 n=1 Tax=Vitis vinifera TaxID=29760 RepID=A0A438GTN4_VITVI|nr:putative disease resistance RPP13-like protein 1 [Vitis vinifera]
MPCGIGELTFLQSLPLFIVGNGREFSKKKRIGSLSELKRLSQLGGVLQIKNLQNERDVIPISKGEILKENQYLQSLRLEWRWWDLEAKWDENDELVMEGLQPHLNLKELSVYGYEGRKFPSWMMNDGLDSLLPNLCHIEMWDCSRCQILPPFSQLPFLKSLELYNMKEVEDMKESSPGKPFFPSLQILKFYKMPKLTGLWRMDILAEQGPSFPHLSDVYIEKCSSLTSVRLSSSPSLSKLYINGCSNLTSFELHSSPSVSVVTIQDCHHLTSFELHSSHSLSIVTIQNCHNLTFIAQPPSPYLSKIDIRDCPNLTSFELHSSPRLSELEMSNCLNMTSLELHSTPCLYSLTIRNCPNLASFKGASLPCLGKLALDRIREDVLRQIMSVSASSSLKSLYILKIDGMISLPEELLQHVSTLHTLSLQGCSSLSTLPHWLGNLTSLTHLQILDCRGLATLPHSIGSLTSLTDLQIYKSPELASLPEEMRSLKNLQTLNISFLSTLRGKMPTGNRSASLTFLTIKMLRFPSVLIIKIFHCQHLLERWQKERYEDCAQDCSYLVKIPPTQRAIADNHCKVEAKSDIDVAANARLIENRTSPIQLQSHGFWRWFYWISVNTSNSGLLWFGSSTMLNRQPRFTLHTLKLRIAKIHRRLRNRYRLLLRSHHLLTPSLRPVLRQRGLHLGWNPKPPIENSARRLSSSATPCSRSNPRQKTNSRRRPRSLKAPTSTLLRSAALTRPLSPARAAGPI